MSSKELLTSDNRIGRLERQSSVLRDSAGLGEAVSYCYLFTEPNNTLYCAADSQYNRPPQPWSIDELRTIWGLGPALLWQSFLLPPMQRATSERTIPLPRINFTRSMQSFYYPHTNAHHIPPNTTKIPPRCRPTPSLLP